MNEPEFTPGEWKVSWKQNKTHIYYFVFVKEPDSINIGELAAIIENKADAYLIAAAPDLYVRLEKTAQRMHDEARHSKDWNDCDLPDCVTNRETLAKARGENP